MSALEHVLGDHQAIPPDRGVFLATTRRLHPAICDFTSEPFDEGKLRPLEGLEHQAIAPSAAPLAAPAGAVAAADPLGAADQLAGSGLRWIPVEHIGRSNASPEEVDVVVSVVRDLLGRQWVDAAEKAHPTGAAATWRYVGLRIGLSLRGGPSALIDLRRDYPLRTFGPLWLRFADLAAEGRLIAPDEVRHELDSRDDELKAWASRVPPSARDADSRQGGAERPGRECCGESVAPESCSPPDPGRAAR